MDLHEAEMNKHCMECYTSGREKLFKGETLTKISSINTSDARALLLGEAQDVEGHTLRSRLGQSVRPARGLRKPVFDCTARLHKSHRRAAALALDEPACESCNRLADQTP